MAAKKKVLMLLSNPFRPDPRVGKEARTLAEAGHSVTVLAWDRGLSLPAEESWEGVKIVRLGPRSAYDSLFAMALTMPRFYLGAFRRMAASRARVVHCHDFDTLPLGLFAGRLMGMKVVYDSHESYPDMISDSAPGCVVSLVSRLEAMMVRHADAVIGTTSVIKRKFRRLGARRVVTVMNCAESMPPPPQDSVRELRQSLAGPGQTLVTYIGTLERIRGLEEAIAAFHARSGGDFKLVIGGYGPLGKRIESLCRNADNVSFLGPVQPGKVRLYNHAADIMLMTSDPRKGQTGNSIANKVFESMEAGKPVIVSMGTLHEKVVLGSGSGLVTRFGDGAGLFRALRRLRDDRALYARLSENGRAAAKSRYNWGVMAGRLRKLYESL